MICEIFESDMRRELLYRSIYPLTRAATAAFTGPNPRTSTAASATRFVSRKRGRADRQRQSSVDLSATANARHELRDGSRPTNVPVGLHNPQCVGNGEVGIDERAYVEEITGIIVGCTNSKEQGESRESTEEAHTENESSNRSCKKKRM